MDVEQLRVSKEVIGVMRRAVALCMADGNEFVGPAHLLLALLELEQIGPAFEEIISRDDLTEAAMKRRLPGLFEIPEGELPGDAQPAFQRYDSLAWKSPDGSTSVYLDSVAHKIFWEGARRAGDGPYLPKHLLLGYAVCSQKDGDLVQLMGKRPQDVTSAIYALQ